MKKILVTGGAGFIGSNLVNRLLESKHKVTVVDSLISGSLRNIEHIRHAIDFYDADVCDFDFLKIEKQDEIYHLACQASPPKYQSTPIHTLDTCYLGTRNVLEIAKHWNSPVLFASTSEIYGDPLEHPQQEKYRGNVSTISPRSCYDEGKRIAETLCYEYSKFLPIKVARIFNTYGPKMDALDGRVVSNFIWQAINHQPLTIFGDGSQTRSLCFVSDNVNALTRFMQTDTGSLKILNIGNDEELTILDLANLIQSITKTDLPFQYQQLPEADPTKRKPDLRQAYDVLEWKPLISLQEGLKETIDYFSSVREYSDTITI